MKSDAETCRSFRRLNLLRLLMETFKYNIYQHLENWTVFTCLRGYPCMSISVCTLQLSRYQRVCVCDKQHSRLWTWTNVQPQVCEAGKYFGDSANIWNRRQFLFCKFCFWKLKRSSSKRSVISQDCDVLGTLKTARRFFCFIFICRRKNFTVRWTASFCWSVQSLEQTTADASDWEAVILWCFWRNLCFSQRQNETTELQLNRGNICSLLLFQEERQTTLTQTKSNRRFCW